MKLVFVCAVTLAGIHPEADGAKKSPVVSQSSPASDGQLAVDEQLPTEEMLVRAADAYRSGSFEVALQLYETLRQRGIENGHFYYNLGNVYLRSGELGGAIWAYRKSQSFLPRGEDVAANIAFARKQTRDAVAPPEPSRIAHSIFFWHYLLSAREIFWVAVASNFAFWTLLAVRIFRRHEVLTFAVISCAIASTLTVGSLTWRTFAPTLIAVVDAAEASVHSATSEQSVVRFKLHAGTEARVVDTRDGWVRIELTDGKQGWMASERLRVTAL